MVRGNNSFGRGEGRPPHGAGGSRGAGVVAGAAGAAAGVGDGVAAAGGVCAERSQLASKAREAILGKAKRRSLMFIIGVSGATSFAGVRETTDRAIGQFPTRPKRAASTSSHRAMCFLDVSHCRELWLRGRLASEIRCGLAIEKSLWPRLRTVFLLVE